MLQNSNNFVSVTNETTLKMILSSKCELSFILAIFKCGRWTNWFWLTAVWREGWYFLPINGTHHNIDPIQSFSKWKPQDDFHLLLRLVSETLFYIHFCFFFSPFWSLTKLRNIQCWRKTPDNFLKFTVPQRLMARKYFWCIRKKNVFGMTSC